MIYTHLVVALASAGLAFAGGWQVRSWKAGRDDLVQLQAQQSDAARFARVATKAAEGHETQRAAIRQAERVIAREVERVIEKPVYRSVCLDDDGLRLVAAAAAGRAASAAVPADPLPGPDTAR